MKLPLQGLVLFVLFFIVSGCGTAKKTTVLSEEIQELDRLVDSEEMEERQLDTMVVSAPRLDPSSEKAEAVVLERPRYNPSRKRNHDLIHTNLELSFNWEKEWVLGKAALTLQPHFYSQSSLVLDAKGFKINDVRIKGATDTLQYTYNGALLEIDLGKTYKRGEQFIIGIDYIAKPSESGLSGSAITSDKGLFFINPRGEEKNKPTQIWTQGETEWNSKWMPTIDSPNERCTQELSLTVDKKYKTLSNGLLVDSKENSNGTRTDYWKMDQPHAPYLFMVAVGEFAVVEEKWRDIPLSYYVEPEYEASAKAIFGHTPEMLEFFSDKLDFKYPWPKYAQIVVRDYVSGAMENTSAVIFGEFVQKHKQALIDNNNDRIVAHELFHHWFGDYVTCESWANLTMNEGFANYSEYLWFEHKYGREEADYHLLNEWRGYLDGGASNFHPLIHYSYDDKEDMFDAHSYNKGGAVLHMLRKYVGDEAFWAALNKYLNDNAYQSVEVHDLRLAFEEVTGEDLNWFFDQWYLSTGHPSLNVSYSYDTTANEVVVDVEQTQDGEGMLGVFKLPVSIDIYPGGDDKPIREQVVMDQRKQSFRIPFSKPPALVCFDGERMLLGEVIHNKTDEEFAYQYNHTDLFLDRFEALGNIRDESLRATTMKKALKDDFWFLRAVGIQSTPDFDDTATALLKEFAVSDPHSQVRALAINKLGQLEADGIVDLAKEVIEKDSAYNVIALALNALIEKDTDAALVYAKGLEDTKSNEIIDVLGALYAQQGNLDQLPFFEDRLNAVDGFSAISFFESYQSLATRLPNEVAMKSMNKLYDIALDPIKSQWQRLAATKSINDMRNHYRGLSNESVDETEKESFESLVTNLSKIIDEIKTKEESPQLKEIYQMRIVLDQKN